MTSICRGLKGGGDGKSRAAVRMAVTLGAPELVDDTPLGTTPTPAGEAVGTPDISMA